MANVSHSSKNKTPLYGLVTKAESQKGHFHPASIPDSNLELLSPRAQFSARPSARLAFQSIPLRRCTNQASLAYLADSVYIILSQGTYRNITSEFDSRQSIFRLTLSENRYI